MTKKQFNNAIKEAQKRKKREVALYIAHAISKFVKHGKTIIKIPYHFE
jgi:enolase